MLYQRTPASTGFSPVVNWLIGPFLRLLGIAQDRFPNRHTLADPIFVTPRRSNGGASGSGRRERGTRRGDRFSQRVWRATLS
jgi:hypothetical protein